MKKFRFRLDKLLRHRQAELTMAQKEYAEARKNVDDQLVRIKFYYSEIDSARESIMQLEKQGGNCSAQINMLDEFISGQKIRISHARQKARELMQVAEDKHEILNLKLQAHKVIEKLKEKKQDEYRKQKNKHETKVMDDLTIMRSGHKEQKAI